VPAVTASKWRTEAGWDDAPHLGEKEKAEQLAACPIHLREARSKGIPSQGAGSIYPFAVDSIKIDPMVMPPHFRRGYALDDGWDVTAVLFFARDPDQDILYVTSELYLKEHKPNQVAPLVLMRANWTTSTGFNTQRTAQMPGVGDAARKDRDGAQIIDTYRNLGMSDLVLADKPVEAGIYDVQMRLATGRLKIFSTCTNTLWEYQRYHRNEKGEVVKRDDHAMDCLRYGSRPSALQRMIAKPPLSILPSADGLGGGDPTAGY
jgi:hypothetical protein